MAQIALTKPNDMAKIRQTLTMLQKRPKRPSTRPSWTEEDTLFRDTHNGYDFIVKYFNDHDYFNPVFRGFVKINKEHPYHDYFAKGWICFPAKIHNCHIGTGFSRNVDGDCWLGLNYDTEGDNDLDKLTGMVEICRTVITHLTDKASTKRLMKVYKGLSYDDLNYLEPGDQLCVKWGGSNLPNVFITILHVGKNDNNGAVLLFDEGFQLCWSLNGREFNAMWKKTYEQRWNPAEYLRVAKLIEPLSF